MKPGLPMAPLLFVFACGSDNAENPVNPAGEEESRPEMRLRIRMDSSTASATLTWNAPGSTLESYILRRTIADSADTQTIYTTTNVRDTTFTDFGLDGNVEYSYSVGAQLPGDEETIWSLPVRGAIHRFLREWTLDESITGLITGGIAIDFEDQVYVGTTNDVHQYDSVGRRRGPFFFGGPVRDVEADRQGVYVLAFNEIVGFESGGERRFFSWRPRSDENIYDMEPARGDILWVIVSEGFREQSLRAIDTTTGDQIERISIDVRMSRLFYADDMIIVGADPLEEETYVYDLAAREIVRVLSESSADLPLCYAAAGVGGEDGRLFVFDARKSHIQVIRDWQPLTRLAMDRDLFRFDSEFEGMDLDSQGDIYISADSFERGSTIQVFER